MSPLGETGPSVQEISLYFFLQLHVNFQLSQKIQTKRKNQMDIFDNWKLRNSLCGLPSQSPSYPSLHSVPALVVLAFILPVVVTSNWSLPPGRASPVCSKCCSQGRVLCPSLCPGQSSLSESLEGPFFTGESWFLSWHCHPWRLYCYLPIQTDFSCIPKVLSLLLSYLLVLL